MDRYTVRRGLALALAAAIVAVPVAASAQSIIVRAAGPSAKTYPAGKRLDGGAEIVLRKGDLVTVLGNSGSREFRGPGKFRMDTATMTGANIANAVRNAGTKTTRTGAVRGGARWDRPANLWMIEADRPGKACYAPGRGVVMWLPPINFARSITLTRLSDQKAVPVSLGPGQRIADWPVADLPPARGERIRITTLASDPGTVLEFAEIKSAASNNVDLAESLIREGCEAQLEVLLNAAGTPDLEEIREERATIKAAMR